MENVNAESKHRPEPFTTLEGLLNEGLPVKDGGDGWLSIEGPENIAKVLEKLYHRGLMTVGLTLPIAQTRDGLSHKYQPVSVESSPLSYARAVVEFDWSSSDRFPELFFCPENRYSGKPAAFVSYGFKHEVAS